VEEISSAKTGEVLLSDSFKETVKSFFSDISVKLTDAFTLPIRLVQGK
jgi:hypothetical protein